MKDNNDDDADEKKIKRNGRCITRKRRRRVILGAVCNKTVCPICYKAMSASHEVPCSTVMKLYVMTNFVFLRGI
jgi:hypothetical protein